MAAVASIINRIDVFYKYEMNSILHLKILKQIKSLLKHFYLAKSWDGRGLQAQQSPFSATPFIELYVHVCIVQHITYVCVSGGKEFFWGFLWKIPLFSRNICFEIRPFSLLPAISSIDEASNNKVSTQAGKVGKLAFFEKSFSKWKAGKGGEKF